MSPHFTGQESGEEILFTFRQHPYVLWIGLAGGFIAAMALLLIALMRLPESLATIPGIAQIRILAIGGLILADIVAMAALWLKWVLSLGILTTHRLVDADQLGIFRQHISTLALDRIEDVSVSVKGPIQYFLKVGLITVETAGESPSFEFPLVPDPDSVSQKIIAQSEAYKRARGAPTLPPPPVSPPTMPLPPTPPPPAPPPTSPPPFP